MFTLLRSQCSVRVHVRFGVHGSQFAIRRRAQPNYERGISSAEL